MASTTTETTQLEITPISESDWTPIDRFQFDGIDMEVRINEIVVDPVYQMRADGTNPDVVQRYAEIMKQNDPDGWLAFPLIKLFKNFDADSRKVLISGFHRLEAMKLNGYDEIKATVSGGAHLDGIIVASGENADRSQPRTNADIQNIVEMFLTNPELCQWSNAQIARWAQVDAQTVANHERRLLSTPNFGIDNRPETRKFIDKHGNISLRKRLIAKKEKPTDSVTDGKEAVGFGTYMGCRDKAFKAWKAYCAKWGIEGNWDGICFAAEKHCGERGSASLITEDASPDLIREKAQFWQNLLSAIENEPDWVYAYRKPLAGLKKNDEEVGPDLRGLKAKIYDMLDEGSQIYAPELAHVYSVPVDNVESFIAGAKADVKIEMAEKSKKALMDKYDDLSSEHLWEKHLKRFISWERLFAAAQSNWMALKDPLEYSPADESDESLKLQNAIWKGFKEDIEYAVRVINNGSAERGQIWLLKLLVIKPKPTPDLDGLRNNLVRMQGSDTKPNPSILSQAYHVPEDVVISIRFQDNEICSLSIPTETSLSHEDLELISEAATEAISPKGGSLRIADCSQSKTVLAENGSDLYKCFGSSTK